ncbi:ribosome biogenesis GTP-binding protein YihA/YsxC [Bianquea renquensis]|jgi:ribosome biogenesis GTP-binding protein ysxC|uniref:Probable GTP-binding protein EngB n=1 Tax=Bianquea renquensis TaxID=2763661 RepID=A0A926DQL8_9FIRM|nr:ribosome biogenesis GTP-binding protein YihA/YsxC [Bianquea renquensis]MBC8542022.1 YihA family ribosome biogenesis GTP-binding protein [Bianquea renquensis]
MIVNTVSLETVAGMASQIPDTKLPEVAFVGKSNVGKSSLINTLVGRKALARTSSAPGKTRTINFYNVEDLLYFVDLPGYGYAKASKQEQERWGKVIESYLTRRSQLKLLLFLVDIRHEPGANDRQMMEWIRYYQFDPIIIGTKSDKIKRSQIQRQVAVLAKSLGVEDRSRIIPFSALDKSGRDAVWDQIEAALRVQG